MVRLRATHRASGIGDVEIRAHQRCRADYLVSPHAATAGGIRPRVRSGHRCRAARVAADHAGDRVPTCWNLRSRRVSRRVMGAAEYHPMIAAKSAAIVATPYLGAKKMSRVAVITRSRKLDAPAIAVMRRPTRRASSFAALSAPMGTASANEPGSQARGHTDFYSIIVIQSLMTDCSRSCPSI